MIVAEIFLGDDLPDVDQKHVQETYKWEEYCVREEEAAEELVAGVRAGDAADSIPHYMGEPK